MKAFYKKQSGFTLIELLVIIAIIGMLASIILVSLPRIRKKAQDTRIAQDLSQVRGIAGLIYADNSSYANLCSSTSSLNIDDEVYGEQLKILQSDIFNQGGAPLACYADADFYCVNVRLNNVYSYLIKIIYAGYGYGYGYPGDGTDYSCECIDSSGIMAIYTTSGTEPCAGGDFPYSCD